MPHSQTDDTPMIENPEGPAPVEAEESSLLPLGAWRPEVHRALLAMIDRHGQHSAGYDAEKPPLAVPPSGTAQTIGSPKPTAAGMMQAPASQTSPPPQGVGALQAKQPSPSSSAQTTTPPSSQALAPSVQGSSQVLSPLSSAPLSDPELPDEEDDEVSPPSSSPESPSSLSNSPLFSSWRS